jgi:hypothetical protein
MIMVATLVLGTVAVSYEYAFATPRPRAIHPGCDHEAAAQHNPNCNGPRPR